MLFVWKVTLAIVGLCSSFVLSVQKCPCMEHTTCIERNGSVEAAQKDSNQQCQGEEVVCCGSFAEDGDKNIKTVQEPRVSPGSGCGRKRFPDDVKGERPPRTAFYGEAPWTVAVLDKNLLLRCTGSLITPKVVLTAAHCLANLDKPTDLFVRAGEHEKDVNVPIPSQLRSIHKLMPHPDYDLENITNDIGLIVLEQPMELNPVVDVICTPEKGLEIIPSECFLTGFGYNSIENATYRGVLKKINYSTKSHEYCLEEMKAAGASSLFYDSSICGTGDESGACQGNGGGPLYCPSVADPNKMVQIGIASWSINCGETYPSVFTSVKHYLPWLTEKLKELS